MDPQAPGTTLLALFPRPAPPPGKIRKVPFLVSANGLPMLRYQKPQPQKLSATLASLLKTRMRRWKSVDRLDSASKVARWEDEWDDKMNMLLRQSQPLPTSAKQESTGKNKAEKATYLQSVLVAKGEVMSYITAAEKRAKARTVMMTNIIFKERELAEEEKREREQNSHSDD
jgi:hypothetical protein